MTLYSRPIHAPFETMRAIRRTACRPMKFAERCGAANEQLTAAGHGLKPVEHPIFAEGRTR